MGGCGGASTCAGEAPPSSAPVASGDLPSPASEKGQEKVPKPRGNSVIARSARSSDESRRLKSGKGGKLSNSENYLLRSGAKSLRGEVLVCRYWRVNRNETSRLPAALAYKLIRRGCSPADLGTLAMLWPRGCSWGAPRRERPRCAQHCNIATQHGPRMVYLVLTLHSRIL